MFHQKLHHDSNEANLYADMKENIEKDKDLLPPIDPRLAGLVSTMYYKHLSAEKSRQN